MRLSIPCLILAMLAACSSSGGAPPGCDPGDNCGPPDSGTTMPADMRYLPPPDMANQVGDDTCTGSGWCRQDPVPSCDALYGIWGSSDASVWAVGENGAILHRTGGTWQRQPSGTPHDLYAVSGSDTSNIWAVGGGGTILKLSGTSWVAQPSGTKSSLHGVYAADANNAWAVGDRGTILKGDYDSPIRTYTDPRMEMSCRVPGSPT